MGFRQCVVSVALLGAAILGVGEARAASWLEGPATIFDLDAWERPFVGFECDGCIDVQHARAPVSYRRHVWRVLHHHRRVHRGPVLKVRG